MKPKLRCLFRAPRAGEPAAPIAEAIDRRTLPDLCRAPPRRAGYQPADKRFHHRKSLDPIRLDSARYVNMGSEENI